MSRASERDAYEKAQAILRRAGARGDAQGDEYGAGRLTRAQKKSQEKHIPMKEVKGGKLAKFARDAWG